MAMRKKVFVSLSLGLLALSFLLVSGLVLFPVHADTDELADVQQAIKARGAKWQAQENHVSRQPREQRQKRLGLLEPVAGPGEEQVEAAPPEKLVAAPASLDWRSYNGLNYVSPVRDQGSCGSCWAFATAAALESQVLIGKNSATATVNVSEQTLVSCAGAGSCGGGYIGSASNYIRDVGLPAESCFAYTATNNTCSNACVTYQTQTSTINGWHYVASGTPSVESLKTQLATYGPLVTTMTVYSDFYYYQSGVYEQTSGTAQGGHAVLLVGYDDVGQYFIVKNSWGPTWGEQGYFRIAYSQLAGAAAFARYTIAYEGWRGDPDTPPTPVCTYAISPTSKTFQATGGTGTVTVTTSGGCGWTAASNVAWITVTSGAGGSGSGAVTYRVAANSTRYTRTGTLSIAGQTCTVTQKGTRLVKK
jgi:C1A family cysteine protease